jgi:L-fuculose-phosphate aldolase
VTLSARNELLSTARRMQELGLAPGTSGNVSVRTPQGFFVTPTGIPYGQLQPDDMVEIKLDGTMRPGQRAPSSEWQLHRDLLATRQDVQAIVHTHSAYCTTIACLRRPIPAIHYMIALSGTAEIPCADYATYGSAELAANVARALERGRATLMANHGMVAIGDTLADALRLATEIETLAGHYWRALQIGTPVLLDGGEVARVGEKFRDYGQPRSRTKRSW